MEGGGGGEGRGRRVCHGRPPATRRAGGGAIGIGEGEGRRQDEGKKSLPVSGRGRRWHTRMFCMIPVGAWMLIGPGKTNIITSTWSAWGHWKTFTIWIKVGPNQARQKKAASSSEKDLGVKHKTNSTTKGVQCNYWARTRPRTNTNNEMNKASARRENKVKSKTKREKND